MVRDTLIHPGATPEVTAKTWAQRALWEFRERPQWKGCSEILEEVVSAGFEVRSLPEGNARRTLAPEGMGLQGQPMLCVVAKRRLEQQAGQSSRTGCSTASHRQLY